MADMKSAMIAYAMLDPRVKSLESDMASITQTGDVYIGSQLVRKVLTQAEYDLLDPPDPKVDYLIVPASNS